MSAVSVDAVRRALARFACGVVVVASRSPRGAPHCVIASAFNSVSLDPPLLFWCVPAAAESRLDLDRAYGLSVLSERQAVLLEAGSLHGEPLAWDCGDMLGAPVLRDAAASFEVVAVRRIPHGDHDLYLAQVAGVGYSSAQNGLLRYSGAVAIAEACV